MGRSCFLGLLLCGLLSTGMAARTPPASATADWHHQLDQAVAAARKGNLDAAFILADAVYKAHPDDNEAASVRDILKQRAVMAHLGRAHVFDRQGKKLQAAVEYRSALAIDDTNIDAKLGLESEFPAGAQAIPSDQMRIQEAAGPVEAAPTPGRHDFHIHEGLRAAAGEIAGAYGLRVFVANTVPDVNIRMDIADASFVQAWRTFEQLGGVGDVALDSHTLYVGTSQDMEKLQPLLTRTFYLPWVHSPAEFTEITQMLFNVLDLRNVRADPAANAITARASQEQLDATERLLLDLQRTQGDVVLDVKLIEVSRSAAETLGISEPTSFQLFSLGPLLSQLSQSGNLQSLISQFFTEGGLNGLLNGGQIPANLLQSLEGQLSPLLQQPFAVFGGGATLMAVTIPGASISATMSSSQVNTLEDAWLRAGNGQAADLKVGQRYPIVNASFSPIYLSSAITQVIGNGSYIQPFPSFTYEDLGLEVKLTPQVTELPTGKPQVNLAVEASVKALSGAESNGVPVISDRDVVTQLTLQDGEPALIGGLFSQTEEESLAGIPGLSAIPALGLLFSQTSPQRSRDQLLIVVTPHVVRAPAATTTAIYLPPGFGINQPPGPEPSLFPTQPGLLPGQVVPQPPIPGPGRGGRG